MKRLGYALSSVLLLAACSQNAATVQRIDFDSLVLSAPGRENIHLQIEIADVPAEQAKGLMGRTGLKPLEGMLFVFNTPATLSFWMKDTLIPLDILFFDANGKFLSSKTMTPCKTDPCPTYGSEALAQYALEVPAGFVQKHGIGSDWTMAR